MNHDRCPICKKIATEPINLKCDHHPCFSCASKLMAVDAQNSLEIKYKIVCPACFKKTVTYDIRHLIISMTEQDEDIYVTSKYLNKKPEIALARSHENRFEDSTTPSYGHSKKNSIQSIASKYSSKMEIQCKKHPGYPLQYFCYDCHKKSNNEALQCSECHKQHKIQHRHKIVSLKQGLEKISSSNRKKLDTFFPDKKREIQTSIHGWKSLQELINVQYEKIYKDLNDQFKQIYKILNQKYENMRKTLKSQFIKQSQEIKHNIELNNKTRQSFITIQKMDCGGQELQSQINIYLALKEVEEKHLVNPSKTQTKSELPKLVKKTGLLSQVIDEAIQISTSSSSKVGSTHSRQLSYGNSPIGSARYLNYASQKQSQAKKPTNNSNNSTNNINTFLEQLSWKFGKQNIKGSTTPKNGICFDFNKLTL